MRQRCFCSRRTARGRTEQVRCEHLVMLLIKQIHIIFISRCCNRCGRICDSADMSSLTVLLTASVSVSVAVVFADIAQLH